jgi:hypothetical protein
MKIDGMPIGNERLGKTESASKNSATTDSKRIETAKSQENTITRDRLDIEGFSVDTEPEPRMELIETVARRLAGGEYYTPGLTESVAKKLVEQNVLPVLTAGDSVRTARMNDVAETVSVSAEFYDNAGVVREIAGKIAPIIGYTELTGG